MASTSHIEWTDATWNPVTGCTRVSAGCDHCYAVAMTRRLEGAAKGAVGHGALRAVGSKYVGLTAKNGKGAWHFNGTVRCHEDVLRLPLTWKKPRRIFVNSMSDLFHPAVPFEFIDKVFAMMALCPQHQFQVLTKRAERAAEYLGQSNGRRNIAVYNSLAEMLNGDWSNVDPQIGHHRSSGDGWWPLPNVWLGTSIESQQTADVRIPHLLQCPAAVRFLSCEPLLGPIRFRGTLRDDSLAPGIAATLRFVGHSEQVIEESMRGVDWVIVGGESGPGARPMHPAWARSIRDQCQAASVAFFFKQWGEWSPCYADSYAGNVDPATGQLDRPHDRMGPRGLPVQGEDTMFRVGKKAAGRVLDGRTWDEFPSVQSSAQSAERT